MAIEVTAGDVKAQVVLLCRHLVAGGIFSQNSFPSDADLDRNIDAAESELLTWLASEGYSTSVAGWSATAVTYVSWYNALGAAYRVELAHTGASLANQASTRADSYYQLYMKFWEMLSSGDLDLGALGIPFSASIVSASITGVSEADKEVLTTDPDVVQPSFSRDMFKHPSSVRTQQLADPRA